MIAINKLKANSFVLIENGRNNLQIYKILVVNDGYIRVRKIWNEYKDFNHNNVIFEMQVSTVESKIKHGKILEIG